MRTTTESREVLEAEFPITCYPDDHLMEANTHQSSDTPYDSARVNTDQHLSVTSARNNGAKNVQTAQDSHEKTQNNVLPFVMVEEPLQPASRQHRKTVRHHVMKAVHSRRRAQNKLTVRKHTLLQKDTSALSDPEPLALKASADSALTSQLSFLDSQTSSSGARELTISPSVVANPTNEDRYQDIASHNDSAGLQGQPNHANARGGTMEDSQFFSIAGFFRPFDQWTFDTTTPYALFQLDGAPTLCMRPENWPFTEPLGRLTPKVSVWMPSRIIPIPNFRSPRDCLHNSALVLPHIHNSEEYFAFKVETIKWINSRLSHKILGTSDTTIGSILLLISFEIARGNIAESLHHVNGLERIVNLRGGITSFCNNRHFLIKVLLIDLIVSITSNTSPRFTSNPTTVHPLLPSNILGIRLNRISDSPLSTHPRLEHILHGSPFCEKSIQMLQHMQDLIKRQESHTLTYTIPHLVTTSHIPLSLHRIIHLTSTMFACASQASPVSFSSPLHQPYVQELCQALESPANDATWDAFPGIFVWILLTGAAAAPDTSPEHSYFVSLLMKVGLGAGYGWFEEFSKAMRVFRDVKWRAAGLLA